MIKFENLSQQKPYLIFLEKYEKALNANQKNIEAASVSSYDKTLKEVNSRYVNIKFINNDEFIFYSNYNSPKANSFYSHNQISALFFWSSINVQIRIKAIIKKTSDKSNQKYFSKRSREKNALAISSNQSKPINSYIEVKKNYSRSLENDNLSKCPDYWGGFSFVPYYFEFWEGHESRLNKRETYERVDENWRHSFLQP